MIHPEAWLPPESPLAMPQQDFARAPRTVRRPAPPSDDMSARRAILILTTLLLAVAAGTELRLALAGDGLGAGELALLLLFFPLFAWIAFGFAGALIGFVELASGRIMIDPPPPGQPIGRTAILLPIRNEDVAAVFGRVAAMARAIDATGAGDRFAFFLLSDSGPAEGAAEERAFPMLRRHAPVAVHYRRRPDNHGRKPGNVADWVRRFGGAWDYMLVLDADSMMGGATIAGLAAAMDARPGVGLIQTVPHVAGARTLFARWHQFATRLYGPVASAGLMWWSGTEATCWGHNAILRTRAFAESCGLPRLAGPAPLGGQIMSHDMVEAALLRRRGWAAHMIMVAGSVEEYPPTLVDYAIRDRRWCQGNMQHVRLLGAAGFHWVSRLQLLVGASAYITSPLWLLLLVATLAGQLAPGDGAARSPAPSAWILALTMVLLFGPKLLGLLWAAIDPARRASFGGGRRLMTSVAADIPLSILTAPATMLTQTLALVDILRGRASGWAPQSRESEGISLGRAMSQYRPHFLVGLALLVTGPLLPAASLWLLPVTLGLVSAPFVAAWTSRRDLGDRAAAAGLFQVPGSAATTTADRPEAMAALPRAA